MLYFPLLLIIKVGSIYSKAIKLFDARNHDTFWEEELEKEIGKKKSAKIKIENDKYIRFYTPSKISSFRAKTIFTKEPDTIKWINAKGGKNKIFYDIGANMGLFTIFYSKKFGGMTYAFEPSFLNLNLIRKNISLNQIERKVFVIPNPLYDKPIFSNLFQMRSKAGDAGTTFKDKKVKNYMLSTMPKAKKNFTGLKVMGQSIDNLVIKKLIKKPNLIKIDVDGNETEVLNGAKKTIRESKKISILVEIQSYNKKKAERLLKSFGLKKISEEHNNFIWQK